MLTLKLFHKLNAVHFIIKMGHRINPRDIFFSDVCQGGLKVSKETQTRFLSCSVCFYEHNSGRFYSLRWDEDDPTVHGLYSP